MTPMPEPGAARRIPVPTADRGSVQVEPGAHFAVIDVTVTEEPDVRWRVQPPPVPRASATVSGTWIVWPASAVASGARRERPPERSSRPTRTLLPSAGPTV